MPLVLLFVAGPLFWFWLLRLLARKRILTGPRLVLLVVLPMLAYADFLLTVPLYLAHKTIWPPLRPEWTWAQLIEYICYFAPGDTVPRWWYLTLDLFRARPAGFWLTQIPAVLAAFPLARWAWLSGWPVRRGDPEAARTATHGSTRWRKPGELKTTLARVVCDRPAAAGVVVGSDGRHAWVTRPEAGNPHVLVVGATRSGKSRRVILPTVWALGHDRQSMILTDPKGELYAHTAKWLQKQGYNVVLIDLLSPARGNRYNPLAAITHAHEAGNDEEASRAAWEIGHILAWSQGAGTDPIWPQAEESLIAALSLAVAIEAPPEARHMATAYRILTELGANGGKALDEYFCSLPADHAARLAYGTAALSESRTRSSIYTGTAAHLRLWGEPGTAWLCAQSDHDPAEAGLRPTAIFLLLPDELGARRQIASLYVNQAYAALAAVARRAHGGKLPVPVWFLLDEFGNIGRLPNLAEKLTVAAGRNIRFVLAVQALAQIAYVYGPKAAEIVTGNCDTLLFLRTSDLDTAKAVSQKAGTYTVKATSVQRRPGNWAASASESVTGRPLLTPDEVLRWPLGQALLLQAGQFPARLPLADLSAWRAAAKAFNPVWPAAEVPKIGKVQVWTPGGASQSASQPDLPDLPTEETAQTEDLLSRL